MRTVWERIPTPDELAEDQWCYEQVVDDGYLLVVAGPDAKGYLMAVSHCTPDGAPGRWPGWDEVMDARSRFCPSHVVMAALMPGVSVDLHDATIVLREVVKREVVKVE